MPLRRKKQEKVKVYTPEEIQQLKEEAEQLRKETEELKAKTKTEGKPEKVDKAVIIEKKLAPEGWIDFVIRANYNLGELGEEV